MIGFRDKMQDILNEEIYIIDEEITDCVREKAWVMLGNLKQIRNKLY